jgi:hypothetical protein
MIARVLGPQDPKDLKYQLCPDLSANQLAYPANDEELFGICLTLETWHLSKHVHQSCKVRGPYQRLELLFRLV